MEEDMKHEGKDGKNRKAVAIAVSLLLIGTAIGALIYWQGGAPNASQEGTNPSNPTSKATYTGSIIPSEYLAQGTRGSGTRATDGYYFVGYKNDNPENIISFEIATNTNFEDITGGEFEISSENGNPVLKDVVSIETENTTAENLGTTIDTLFTNIEVSFTSLSVVYNGYTFGVGTTGSEDYIWIAPKKSYPTFFTDIEIKGVTFDERALDVLKSNFKTSVFDKIDLNEVENITQKFSFDFSGMTTKFLIVTNVSYLNPLSINGDVIDTITPADIERLANAFENEGTGWLQSIVGNVGEGIAIVSERDNTIGENTLWFLLYSTDEYGSFPGICNLEVYESDMNNLTKRIPTLDLSSFNLHLNFSFKLKVGIIGDVSGADYSQSDVKSLWSSLESPHSSTMVKSVDVKGFAVVVDLKTLIQSLGEAFNIDKDKLDAITKLTTFKNPAFALMLDENLPNILKDNGTEAWKYASIAIIPNYDAQNSALRYLDLKGTLYDPAEYFGIDSSLAHIPIIVTDSYSEVMDNIQDVTVKDLKEGNVELNEHGWAYVDLDAITAGTTLKKLADELGNTGVGKAVKTAVKAFPLDLGAYDGLQTESISEIYQVPIIYVAAGHGPTYYHLNITHIRGMYVDVNADFTRINELIQDKLGIDTPSLSSILEAILPANVTEPINNFTHNILNSSLVPSGYILAFSMDEIDNAPPTVAILQPLNGTNITASDFNITFSVSDNPDMVLWVELNIDVPLNGIPLPILRNGDWSTGDLWWWHYIQDYIIGTIGTGDYTITIRAHDFHGYGGSISVSFSIG